MNSVVGRILTSVCGGILMAGFNRWNALTGWLYWVTIACGVIVCFLVAVLIERRSARKRASLPVSGKVIGSYNKSGGSQEIEIGAAVPLAKDGCIGSHNDASGDQKIKIG